MFLGLVGVILSSVAGCAPKAENYLTPERLQNGLVIILPGIEGPGLFSQAVRVGLSDAQVNQGMRYYDWSWPVPVAKLIVDQVDTRRARAQAAKLAHVIQEYQRDYPGRPVHLVGHSGGAAVAVFAAEDLPDGCIIDGIIMLRPSLSVGYDLSKALGHTCKGIVNFWSPADVALLMVGTTLFGNLDGVHGPAGGAMGFVKPSDVDQADKLHQLPWTLDQVLSGNLGDHFTVAASTFVKDWVAPWVKLREWPTNTTTRATTAEAQNSSLQEAAPQTTPAAKGQEQPAD